MKLILDTIYEIDMHKAVNLNKLATLREGQLLMHAFKLTKKPAFFALPARATRLHDGPILIPRRFILCAYKKSVLFKCTTIRNGLDVTEKLIIELVDFKKTCSS